MCSTNKHGFYVPHIDKNKCNDCGRCAKICPQMEIASQKNTIQPKANFPRFFAALVHERLPELKLSSTSGLAFLLTKSFMFYHAKAVVTGCSFNLTSKRAEHIVISDPSKLALLCGSKYVQSFTHDAMTQTAKLVRQGPVLFIGTPCQVAGIKNATPKKFQENLTTIDLLCHGVPSAKALDAYFKRKGINSIKAINFRYRNNKIWDGAYNLKIVEQNNLEHCEDTKHDAYLKGFLGNYDLNECCYHCRYTNTHRTGDLTVGDFWGVDHILKSSVLESRDPGQGVSLLMVNTIKGQKFLDDLLHDYELTLIDASKEEAEASNGVLCKPSSCKLRKRITFKILSRVLPYYTALMIADKLNARRFRRRFRYVLICLVLLYVSTIWFL